MYQVHIGAFVSLIAPGKTDYTACHPRKATTYIFYVVPITTHTHVRPKSIGKEKQRKERKMEEIKSTHDAYENTRKCGELKLYFSPSAGG